MAMTRAQMNKKVRQEALRDQLSAQGHVQHVVDSIDKLESRWMDQVPVKDNVEFTVNYSLVQNGEDGIIDNDNGDVNWDNFG